MQMGNQSNSDNLGIIEARADREQGGDIKLELVCGRMHDAKKRERNGRCGEGLLPVVTRWWLLLMLIM